MEKLTKALMTDETGQAIVSKLNALTGQMHELAMATRGSAILFESESDISVLGDGGYLAVYVGTTNPLVISGWTGDNSLVTGHLYYIIKSGTAVASSDLGEYGGTAVTDTTLSISGSAADAKAVGDALAVKADANDVDALDDRVTILEAGGSGSGLTADIKSALLACFANVAWAGNDGQDFYDALDAALNPPANLVSISAVYTQSGAVYTNTSLDSLKSDLVVTATYSDSTTSVISSGYTLSGTLTEGTSAITVSYGGKTTTFNVTVIPAPKMEYDTDDGDLVIVEGGNEALNAISGEILANTANNSSRRGVYLEQGAKPVYRGTQQSYVISGYYPVPVPPNATSAQVVSDVSTSYLALNQWLLTENGYVSGGSGSGWSANNIAQFSFEPADNRYLTLNCKSGPTGTPYSDSNPAPSRFIITFSE